MMQAGERDLELRVDTASGCVASKIRKLAARRNLSLCSLEGLELRRVDHTIHEH